jgi:hypothetical protein
MNNNVGWLGVIPFIIWIGVIAVAGIPFWKICGRTGLSKGLVFVLLVPIVGWIILPWIIGFSTWPVVDYQKQK